MRLVEARIITPVSTATRNAAIGAGWCAEWDSKRTDYSPS